MLAKSVECMRKSRMVDPDYLDDVRNRHIYTNLYMYGRL